MDRGKAAGTSDLPPPRSVSGIPGLWKPRSGTVHSSQLKHAVPLLPSLAVMVMAQGRDIPWLQRFAGAKLPTVHGWRTHLSAGLVAASTMALWFCGHVVSAFARNCDSATPSPSSLEASNDCPPHRTRRRLRQISQKSPISFRGGSAVLLPSSAVGTGTGHSTMDGVSAHGLLRSWGVSVNEDLVEARGWGWWWASGRLHVASSSSSSQPRAARHTAAPRNIPPPPPPPPPQ
mmetsp:Transcript_19663/g.57407  ORF Transcript_19663/g.57407 Transcript_19663/m.57407 type:complete len:232 (+) Transcript_19663:231-926(+)